MTTAKTYVLMIYIYIDTYIGNDTYFALSAPKNENYNYNFETMLRDYSTHFLGSSRVGPGGDFR